MTDHTLNDVQMRDLLVDFMGKGFLENIIALMKQDGALCRFIPDLLADENLRVRLGATALIEELAATRRDDVKAAVPGIVNVLLHHDNPTIRGDAAGALGIIRDAAAVTALRAAIRDGHEGVRAAAQEALDEIGAE